MPAKHHLITWLREAYAMELQSIEALERQIAQNPHDDMALSKRLQFHLEETLNQADKIQFCLEHLGSHTRAIKVGLGKLLGNMHAISTALGTQEAVKTAIVGIVFERFEVATYQTLIQAAQAADEPEIADVCRRIMVQELAMAEWVEMHLPEIAQRFLKQPLYGAQQMQA